MPEILNKNYFEKMMHSVANYPGVKRLKLSMSILLRPESGIGSRFQSFSTKA
jgi:hypothetical protein